MPQALKASIPFAEYLAMDDASQRRHEYLAGQVYLMTGGSQRHNRIAINLVRLLADRLEGMPCQVFINDMKLHVEAADCVYYPDVFVHCGSGVATADKLVRDATLVVEVLSGSTAGIDRREKLLAYRKLPGLREYWMVSQDEQRVELHSRTVGGDWQVVVYVAGDAIPAESVGGEPIAVSRLYAGTDLA